MTKHEHTVNFLDVCITIEGKALNTTLYTKESDRNNLLRRYSHHAPQTFKGIPKGQFVRARKICLSDAEYHKHKTALVHKFTSKGYDREDLIKTGDEVGKIQRTQLCQYSPHTQQKYL